VVALVEVRVALVGVCGCVGVSGWRRRRRGWRRVGWRQRGWWRVVDRASRRRLPCVAMPPAA